MKIHFAKSIILFLVIVLTGCEARMSPQGDLAPVTTIPTNETETVDVPENVSVFNSEVICANSFVTQITKVILDKSKSIEYTITQGKDGGSTVVRVSANNSDFYEITVEDNSGKVAQTLVSDCPYWDTITFVDVNLDGYADIQMYVGGTLNEMSDLYLWESSTNKFVKVVYQGFDMLSNYEINDGYLMNWAKKTASSGVIQRLEWDGYTLIKVEEEEYNLDSDS